MNKLDLVGIRFGRLVVQKPARDVRRYSRNYCTWKCLCDCGNSKTVYTEDIRGGSTASCGCLHRDSVRSPKPTLMKYPPKFDKLAWQRDHRKANRQQYSSYLRNSLARMKDAAYKLLGDRCASPNCLWINEDGSKGCTDRRCLQIDHVHGGGKKDRNGGAGRYGMYRKILASDPAYQILCANCNWIKLAVNGEWKSKSPNAKS
jgi:hypothetical protein